MKQQRIYIDTSIVGGFFDTEFEKVTLTDDVKELADKYVAENVVGKTSLGDCRHIALATINKVDVLASWNFKHQAKVYEKTKDMTFPELRAYLDKSLENDSLWQRLILHDHTQKQNMGQVNACL